MEVHHLAVLADCQALKYKERSALRYKDYELGKWLSVSWRDMAAMVEKVALALLANGVGVQENVGIFSQNKPEYLYVELAIYGVRAVSIPFYATSSGSQVQYMLNEASVRLLFVGEQFQYDAAFNVLPICPSLERIILFDRRIVRHPRDHVSVYFDEFLREADLPDEAHAAGRASELARRKQEASPDDLMNILYTSGTTGEPKGVLLHHGALLDQVRAHAQRLNRLTDRDVSMCFLPLTHVFEKAFTYFCLEVGAEVCINLKPADIQTSMREIHPTVMCAVPRFWEKVYQAAQEIIQAASGVKKALMLHALSVGKAYNIGYVRLGKRPPLGLELQYKFYDRTVFSLIKRIIGVERGNFYPTAGAAIPDKVNEFIRSVGIPILIGYGLTETMATVSCDLPDCYTIGSVGRVIPGLQIKFGANSEILLKGSTITRGYYKKEAITRESFTEDGFFRTGDAGYMVDGELYLTDRIKDLFKTSNGKYIAPQQLEAKLVVDRYIDQIVIIADQRKFVSALIVPVYPAVKDYAARHNISYSSLDDLLRHPRIIELFKARIDTIQQQFAHYEQVKRFLLLPRPFSLEQGELTNTLKIRRDVVAKHYADEIERMYREAEAEYNPVDFARNAL